MAIVNVPNGIIKETKRTFSDVDFISKGEQIYYEGKVYQATTDVGAVSRAGGWILQRILSLIPKVKFFI